MDHKRLISLAYLTIAGVSPPEHVALAAAADFRAVGLRLIPVLADEPRFAMRVGSTMMNETVAHLRDTGLSVLDIELVRLESHTDMSVYLPIFETAAALGARNILTTSNEPDERVNIDRLQQLCELGADFGLHFSLEFMRWAKGVQTLEQALRIVDASRAPNAHVMIDAYHFHRTGADIQRLKKIPPERLAHVQLCDAPLEIPPTIEQMIEQGRYERLFPGEGELDLIGLLKALPFDSPVSVEAPKRRLAGVVGYGGIARRAYRAADTLLDSLHRS